MVPSGSTLEGAAAAAAAKGERGKCGKIHQLEIKKIDYDAHLSPYSFMVTGTFDLSTV